MRLLPEGKITFSSPDGDDAVEEGNNGMERRCSGVVGAEHAMEETVTKLDGEAPVSPRETALRGLRSSGSSQVAGELTLAAAASGGVSR